MVATHGTGRRENAVRVFQPRRSSASEARLFVTVTLHGWGDDKIMDNAITVTNELFINAVTHAGTVITVRLRRLAGVLIAEVEDLDPREPSRTHAGMEDESSRGLELVEALSIRWGCRPMPLGKVVWAEIATDDKRPDHSPPWTHHHPHEKGPVPSQTR